MERERSKEIQNAAASLTEEQEQKVVCWLKEYHDHCRTTGTIITGAVWVDPKVFIVSMELLK